MIKNFQPSQAMASTSRIATLTPALLLATAMIAFAISSYPMMRPGLDVWVHLGLIESPEQINSSILSTSRLLWHYFWHAILESLGIHELFDRALLIHRTQSLLTLGLIATGSYFTLSTLVPRRDHSQNSELWLAAMLSAIIWLLMNGTESSARAGGPDSTFIQSWIVWYSINYQISLPLYFASVGLFLYALTHTNKWTRRALALAISLTFISLATLAHAAETAYFLICLAFIALIYQKKGQRWKALFGLSTLAGLLLWGATHYSYITPVFLKLKSLEDFKEAASAITAYGIELTQNNLNRTDTTWHAMYSACLISLCFAAFFRWKMTQFDTDHILANWRPWIFIFSTASMPLALMHPFTAGSLAMITHLQIAWRFSFASFLFIGPAALGLIIANRIPLDRPLHRQLILSACVIAITLLALIYSQAREPSRPSINYARSLAASLSKTRSFFGITEMEKMHLQRLVEMRNGLTSDNLLCTDVFTAYYLFFIKDFHAVNMPSALHYLPGFRSPDLSCQFERSPGSLPQR